MNFAGETNKGLVYQENEDSFVIVALPHCATALAVVADGLGGHPDGAVASRFCCRVFADSYLRNRDKITDVSAAKEFLKATIAEINSSLYEDNKSSGTLYPSGTTVVAAIFFSDRVVVASAGDSRCYELGQDGKLLLLTIDHVYGDSIAAEKNLSPERKKMVSASLIKAIGPRHSLVPDVEVFDLHAGSRYLLCSDGLSKMVSDEKISAELAQSSTPRNAVDHLMRQALIGGGRDNITVVTGFCDAADL
jgi:protein phosphatase